MRPLKTSSYRPLSLEEKSELIDLLLEIAEEQNPEGAPPPEDFSEIQEYERKRHG